MKNAALAQRLEISPSVLAEWKWSVRHCPAIEPLEPNLDNLLIFQGLNEQMGLSKARQYLRKEF